nr:MAG TPA: hypothetical protein [Caudoviricetes sp.]
MDTLYLLFLLMVVNISTMEHLNHRRIQLG